MLLGRLELHRGHLAPAQLGQDLRPLLLGGGLGERPPQVHHGCSRGAAVHRVGGGRPQRVHPALVPRRGGQQQVRGDPLSRSAVAGQRRRRGGVPRLPLAGREVLVQRRPHDRVHEPQALGGDEDIRPDKIVGRLPGRVLAQVRHASGEPQLAVISEHGDRSRQLGRRRAECGQPVQDEAAHRGRAHHLHFARGRRRRRHPRGVQGSQQLTQEQRVAAGGRVARAAELLGCLRAQPLPRQRHRGRLAQRPRVQRHPRRTRGQLRPQ